MSDPPTLQVDGLTVAYRNGGAPTVALREVDLSLRAGQVYGLVGESGSGKTTLALAVMRYLARQAEIQRGSIRLSGRELISLPRRELRRIWRSQLALVPQDPAAALNPSLRINRQLQEALPGARPELAELLRMVRISDPPRVLRSYPHELSGGMQQRVLIAMALGKEPELLVLDEPTTGLDSTTEAAVLDLVRELMADRRTATLYVSHSLGVIAQFADRVAVLYASELVEDAPKRELFAKPLHPYTQGLLDSVPRLGESKRQIQLRAIGGAIPSLRELPQACVFAPRCPLAIEVCWEERPTLEAAGEGRRVRCHRWQEIHTGEVDARQPLPPEPQQQPGRAGTALQVNDLTVQYRQRRSVVELIAGRAKPELRAVAEVDLALARGETVGLVGESGSGKTSLARGIIGLVEPRSGRIELLGELLPPTVSQRRPEVLRMLQMVFQNPNEALNPYLTVRQSLERPLVRLPVDGPLPRVRELLEAVRLPAEFADRYPGQLSGGERQRVAIARAFAAFPEVVLADEPVSSLDVSVQASILNLLSALQSERGNGMLFISHDIAVVGYLSDRVGVLYAGQLMEISGVEALFEPPYHPYTEALLAAVPLLDPTAKQRAFRLEGEPESLERPITGCPFHTRCPRFLGEICLEQVPPWRDQAPGKQIFCHIPIEDLRRQQLRVFEMAPREAR